MSNEMIERVAKAIRDSDGTKGIGHWMIYVNEARAAIQAMAEPTWQMCSAGGMEHSKMVKEGNADANDPDLRYIFQAMIEQALEPDIQDAGKDAA